MPTYSCYTAALDGSCAAHALSELPFFALPVASGRPRCVVADNAGWRRSFAGWKPSASVPGRNRPRSVAKQCVPCGHLVMLER
jgi:hypothetical protein